MKRELKNALYHFIAGVLFLAPAAYLDNLPGWVFAAFCYALVRETTEEQLKHPHLTLLEAAVDSFRSWRDYLSWTLAGLAIGLAS